jgi:hypothetical protein
MKLIKFSAILLITFLLTASSSDQLISPPENYKHWQKLEKVCEENRKTYGVNEFVENGKICRWTFVSYWPEKKGK